MKLDLILKALLKEEGITIAQLSKKTKVPTQTIHNWLSGMEPRSLKQVRKIADYFEVSIDYLCFGIKTEKTKPFENYSDEINAGIFEVVLRRIKK